MKGIILAGGSATRLHPITLETSKQLLPVYDKPMIYYPLATLMYLGIKDILIISTPIDTPRIKRLLDDGTNLGIKISYTTQEKPKGIAESFIIAEDFIGNDSVALILGDNIFYGPGLANNNEMHNINSVDDGATILAYHVSDPERYGVVTFSQNHDVISIEEKPQNPNSNWAVTGLYFYDNKVIEYAKSLVPSKRGELEITDINNIYLQHNQLKVQLLKRGFAWLDTGTPDSLLEASNYIQTIQKRQGFNIACIEEIAYRKGYITLDQLKEITVKYKTNNQYNAYLIKLISDIESSYA